MSVYRKRSSLILSLYIPWLLSVFFQAAPVSSYLIAWLGSFFIFYQTWVSRSRFLLSDLKPYQQIMRPVFLQQAIFAGFMCCTSIFFFLDCLGYKYLEKINEIDPFLAEKQLSLVAKCQSLSVFAHASLVTGILVLQDKKVNKHISYKPSSLIPINTWIIQLNVITYFASILFENIPALFQFSIGLYRAAAICGAFILVDGIQKRDFKFVAWGGGIFILNFLEASLSGFKEQILVNVITITCLLFPYYRRTVGILSIPIFILLFYITPTYSTVIRKQSWSGNTSAEEARSEALETVLEDEETIDETNWEFLTNRFSEIGMFAGYVESTPSKIPYYNTELLQNSIIAIIPRALWPDKPITEELAMERVYNADVIDRRSKVSAKTRPVVDGYLSGGLIGIFLYMFFLGAIAQYMSNKAENLFGGYQIGCVIMFNGFFQILWRGETIEFMLNSIFWGYIAMMLLFAALRTMSYLEKVYNYSPNKYLF